MPYESSGIVLMGLNLLVRQLKVYARPSPYYLAIEAIAHSAGLQATQLEP